MSAITNPEALARIAAQSPRTAPPAPLPPAVATEALDRVSRVVTASTTLASVWDYAVVDAVVGNLSFTEALALGELLSSITGTPAKLVETMAAWASQDEEWASHASTLVELVWAHEAEWAVEVAEQGAPTAREVEDAAAGA